MDDETLNNTDNSAAVKQLRYVNRRLKRAKCCLISFLLFLLLFGLAAISVGLLVYYAQTQLSVLYDGLVLHCTLMTALGVFLTAVASVGMFCAQKGHVVGLKLFFGLLVLTFFCELALGVFAYIEREEVRAKTGIFLWGVKSYNRTTSNEIGQLSNMVDQFQSKYQCCGSDGYGDYKENKLLCAEPRRCRAPMSCCLASARAADNDCNVLPENTYSSDQELRRRLHTTGCRTILSRIVIEKFDILGGLALGFSLPQVLGIALTYFFVAKLQFTKMFLADAANDS